MCSTRGCSSAGPVFQLVPELWRELGADGSATGAAEAVEIGNRLCDDMLLARDGS